MIDIAMLAAFGALGYIAGRWHAREQVNAWKQAHAYEKGLVDRYEQEQRDARLLVFARPYATGGSRMVHVHGDKFVTIYPTEDGA